MIKLVYKIFPSLTLPTRGREFLPAGRHVPRINPFGILRGVPRINPFGILRGEAKAECLSGFTLVEILVTLGILAILISLALPQYRGFLERGRQQEGINFLANVHASQWRYFYENDEDWPAVSDDLDIGIPVLKYFNELGLLLNPDGSAELQRDLTKVGGWDQAYWIRVDESGAFSYNLSTDGPGGLPK